MGDLPFFSLQTWILLISFICLLILYGKWTHGIFEKLGIPGPKPYAYLGTVGRHSTVYYMDDLMCFEKYGKIWGMFEFRRPVLAVVDPDMLKSILVKECFTYFTNRRNLRLNGELYDSVSIAENDQWRRIRNNLTPIFASGRIKEMFRIMKHHSNKLKANLQSKALGDDIITVKDFFGGYTLDVMASCAFSVDLDSANNPSNPLIAHSANLFNFPLLLFSFQACFPVFLPLLELLGFTFFSKASTDFFKTFLEKVKGQRSSHQNSGDMLQHMLDSQAPCEPTKGKQGLTDHEILSQATIFVLAGNETSANTLTFLAYNLAKHPEVMKRLQEEIDSTFPDKAPVQYEELMHMEYLDCVVNECLRLYPPIPRLERIAKETVKINGITIPKDMVVLVPIYALHRDPELWPEPEEFRPDRFSKQNKMNIKPYTYLPFGAGPRNCLGLRFALSLVKLAVVEVLQNYSFTVCEETEIPLTMSPNSLVGPLKPIKLKIVTRSASSREEDESN